MSLIDYFINQAKKRNLILLSDDQTPIKSILIGNNKNASIIQNELMNKGYLTGCIRPPSVPNGSAIIRISLTCYHKEAQVNKLLDTIQHCIQCNHYD